MEGGSWWRRQECGWKGQVEWVRSLVEEVGVWVESIGGVRQWNNVEKWNNKVK